jgi:hypothetical protein
MKAILRTAAALAFLSFFTAGALLPGEASRAPTSSDRIFPIVLGLFFMGVACFAGPMLLVAAERCAR